MSLNYCLTSSILHPTSAARGMHTSCALYIVYASCLWQRGCSKYKPILAQGVSHLCRFCLRRARGRHKSRLGACLSCLWQAGLGNWILPSFGFTLSDRFRSIDFYSIDWIKIQFSSCLRRVR